MNAMAQMLAPADPAAGEACRRNGSIWPAATDPSMCGDCV
ncbi:hypothetical protein MES5069_380031 [Mesorhizobium escarrei]|uniref:Uncharacterized protein n=1 Tax=Mesorhizobium escarrei TaxID=666018 RepID=A0ABN8JZM7_9HYPH|nr:hypothetical protein MES5069_380031 [Mesorhizobium escarrei]